MPRPRPRRTAAPARRASVWRFAAGLTLLTIAAFSSVGSHQFVNIDDPQYVFQNAHVADGLTADAVRWAFTSGHAGNWHPLTWISHMLDVEWFGLDPGAHHLTNVALHIAATLLLFAALVKMTGAAGASALVAGLFALHPLRVESVAWIAERKDVLSAMFWMLTLRLYAAYAARPSASRYLQVTVAFACALMSKPSAVTLPLALLLLDYWPLGRAGSMRALREKLPWLAMSVLVGVVTIAVQSAARAVGSLDALPLGTRIANTGIAYATYLWKMIWPAGLAPLYPYDLSPPAWLIAGCWLLVVAVSILVFAYRRAFPAGLMGWAWYLVTLIPMIGLVQVGRQSLADRYTYIPLVGLFIALVWAGRALVSRLELSGRAAAVAASVLLAGLGALTWTQTHVWRDGITLWQHAVETHGSARARANLGQALSVERRWQEALAVLDEAARMDPADASAQHYFGFALAATGQQDRAIERYREAVRLRPSYLEAHGNLAVALAERGDLDEAIVHLREVLRLDPSSRPGRANLASALIDRGVQHEVRGNRQAALASYRDAQALQPGNPELENRIRLLERLR